MRRKKTFINLKSKWISIKQRLKQSLQKAEGLRQSILKQAFEGKLAPQNPNEEPGEKLLEKIKIEKANSEK